MRGCRTVVVVMAAGMVYVHHKFAGINHELASYMRPLLGLLGDACMIRSM